MHRLDFFDGDLIVAPYLDLCPQLPDILNQVVGERIVIIEYEDHAKNSLA